MELRAIMRNRTVLFKRGRRGKMTPGQTSARQRLLETASELFYREGIRAIGVDTIVERSGVGKATLYRHFPTKDDLIAAYIEQEDRAHLQGFDETIAAAQYCP